MNAKILVSAIALVASSAAMAGSTDVDKDARNQARGDAAHVGSVTTDNTQDGTASNVGSFKQPTSFNTEGGGFSFAMPKMGGESNPEVNSNSSAAGNSKMINGLVTDLKSDIATLQEVVDQLETQIVTLKAGAAK